MEYRQAYDKLKQYGQLQVLRYYEELTKEQQASLLAQIEEIDFEVIKSHNRKEECKGRITPLASMQLEEIEEKKERFRQAGLAAIRAGSVGALLLAGGMGTRLGFDEPKGVCNIGVTRELYIFECLLNNLMDVVKEAGAWVHLFIMTSEKNHDATIRFFKEHDYFGYRLEYITFFQQEMVPATDCNGKIYMEEKGKMAASPNGNGGWFISMKRCGALDIVYEKKIAWLNVFAVDNVLQKIADPVFIGATLESGCASGAKVVRKNAPDEKVGVVCLEDGQPSVIEYYELTDELRNAKDETGNPLYGFGVILNYLFRVQDLENVLAGKLPLHVVKKQIPYLNEDGILVHPVAPNGYKYETLALDLIKELNTCLPYEIERTKEFAPIKNRTGIDSVDTARELLKANGILV